MALNASLVITADAASATAALGQVDAALESNTAAAKRAGAANDDLGRKVQSGTRQASAGYVNLGRQVQDVAVQLQSGTNLGTIVAQQGGQIADAVAMMGGRFAGLAGFLAGPFGAAVIVGAGVLLNSLIPALFDTGDAAEDTRADVLDLSGEFGALARNADIAKKALADLFASMPQASKLSNAASKIVGSQVQALGTSARLGREREKARALVETLSTTPGGASALDAAVGRMARLDREKAEADRKVRQTEGQLAELRGAALASRFQERNADRLRSRGSSTASAASGRGSTAAGGAGGRALRKNDNTGVGEDIAAKIAKIKDQFSGLPPIIARSNDAMRQLDDIASDLERKKGPNYAELKTGLADARQAIEASLTKPYDDWLEKVRQGAEIDALLLAGKSDQVAVMREIARLQDLRVPMTAAVRAEVEATVIAEERRVEVLERLQDLQGAYLDSTRQIRGELEAMFMGEKPDFGRVFKQLQSRVLVENIFGDALRGIDKAVKSSFDTSVVALEAGTNKAGTAALTFADTLTKATGQIAAAMAGPSAADPYAQFESDFDRAMGGGKQDDYPEILVRAEKVEQPNRNTVGGMTPGEYAELVGRKLTLPIIQQLEMLGIKLPSALSNVIGSAAGGYAAAGPVGAVLGGLKGLGIKGLAGQVIGAGFDGAIAGGIADSLMKAIGIKSSKTGAAIGGALFGPLGGIAGGIIGGMFKKTKSGGVSIGNVDGAGGITGTAGNNADLKSSATSAGGGINSALAQFAERLGGSLGNFSVAIGMRKDEFRVSGSGSASATTAKKTGGDIIYKGKDEGAAIKAALANAIADGAVEGVSAAVQRALKANASNVDRALSEALKVQEIEGLLEGMAGAANKAFADFERQAKERLRVATAYGFDIVKIEELNAKERLKLSKDLLEEQVGSLQRLIDEMTGGSLFEGSAVDKRTALLDQIGKAKAEADAGTAGAADKLAGLLEQLNAVSKDVYGTTGGFAADRTTIMDQARDVIAKANQRIAEAQAKSDPALAVTNAALDENNSQNAEMIALLREFGGGLPPSAAGASSYVGLARLASTQAL